MLVTEKSLTAMIEALKGTRDPGRRVRDQVAGVLEELRDSIKNMATPERDRPGGPIHRYK